LLFLSSVFNPTSSIILCFFVLLSSFKAQESADLVLLIDGSDNIEAANFHIIIELVLKVIEGLDVGRDMVRVALVLYGAAPVVLFNLGDNYNKEAMQNIVQNVKFTGGYDSNLGAALELVNEKLLGPEAGGRAEEGVPQVVVIISAGQSTDDVSEIQRELKQANVFVFGAAIGDSARAQLEAITSDRSFVLFIPDVREGASLGDQLLPYINGVAQRTIVFHNDITEIPVSERDIIFLIDSTMGSTLINAIREFIKNFIDTIPVGPNQVQIGVAMFANIPRLEFDLNAHDIKETLISDLARIRPRPSLDVNIGAALDFVRTNMLIPEKGSRIQEGVPQLVLLITSKKSKDSVVEPAEALQNMGVLTMAAGSRAAEESELQQLAIANKLVFMFKDFRQLLRNPKEVVSALSTVAGVVPPTDPVTETTTIQVQRIIRDIVFLVDGSNNVGNANLPAVRQFITSIVDKLDVRPERVRIGLLQFAEQQRIEFYLNSHDSKQKVLDNIAQLRLIGGNAVNTGAALRFALTNLFKESVGSRRGPEIQKVLVLITASPSQDEVSSIADQVAIAGILTFSVGVGQVEESELKKVAFVESLAYYNDDFAQLPSVAEIIMTPLTTVVSDVATADHGERDVAFLIDGSDAVRRDFPYIRDFILKIIEPLDIASDKVRIAVVQHSERSTPNFFLNTYRTKEEVLRAIPQLSPIGGRSLNTGAALTYMKNTVLSTSAGGRADKNVPQFLIVLTGGKSRDSVNEPASVLKTEGVVPFGIGVKNADSKQIAAISHNPSFAFSVKEFSQLDTVRQKLNSYVSLPRTELVKVLKTDTIKSDVVFLVDGSDDTKNGFEAIRAFVQTIVEDLNVEESGDRVALVQYSRDATANFYLNSYSSKNEVQNSVRSVKHKAGRPLNSGAALQFIKDYIFIPSSGGRHLEGARQILYVFSGGRSNDDIRGASQALRESNVIVVTFGTRNADALELQTMSSTPTYAFIIPDFNFLENIYQVVASITGVKGSSMEFTTFEVETHVPRRDVVFLLDGSDSNRNGFAALKDFVQHMVGSLNVGENKDRVSVVQFSRDADVHFYLITYTTKEDVLGTVSALRHKGGSPINIGAALQYVRDNVFTTSSGSRRLEGVPQMLILLSAERSSDNVDIPAAALKDLGIMIFTIGSRDSDSNELERISFDPRFSLTVSDFTDLQNVQEQFLTSIDTLAVPLTPSFPPSLVDYGVSRKDVVFLLDGSDGARNGFPAMLNFVQRLVETFNIGDSMDRVSVVQYSTNAEVHFYLNTYSTKEEIINAISTVKHKGGRRVNTGSALQYVRENVFTASAGSRRQHGVPNILILLGASRSTDNVDQPASALKEIGVLIFGVGTRNLSSEIQRIANGPSYAHTVSELSDLANVQQQFYSSLSSALLDIKPVMPTVIVDQRLEGRDVVFLLDGSDGTRSYFPAIRDFVQNFADRLHVSDGRDRVSVVQYSRDPEVHFYLNTYTTKESIVDAIRGLRHKGGRPLNTGMALQYVRDNVFTASSGSRRLQGVPQVLILLSGGRSLDNVDVPASSLKELGILIFSVGLVGSDTDELQKISNDPSATLSVTDFTYLPNVQEQLLSIINTGLVGVTIETHVPRRDVVFLLDGSDSNRNGFAAMKDFVRHMVGSLNVGENKDRVSVVQFSRDADVHFYLKTYTTKEDVLGTVSALRHKGGSPINIGAALQYVKDNVFTTSSGSRRLEGVPQMLILLSAERSSDNVDIPAAALKDLGIMIFTIGSRDSDSNELERISFDPRFSLTVSDFTDLQNVQEQFLTSIDTLAVPLTPSFPPSLVDYGVSRKDVVFLLDGSDGARNGFPAMLNFVQRLVETFNIGDSMDRVSVVQYSSNAEVHFYLNTYSTKEEIINAISTVKHKGGRRVNTGSALQYVRENVFTASAGSRRQHGVPNILILLGASRSTDNVDQPASALK
ncbi:hypothetical protein C0J45_0998, partial [Silurus meridionalis]